MTDTPETDELRDDIWATSYVEGSDFAQMFEHARKLERERDRLTEAISRILELATHELYLAIEEIGRLSLTNNQND